MFYCVRKLTAGTLSQSLLATAALSLCQLITMISAHALDVDADRLVDLETIETWHKKKDAGRSTFAGTDAWRSQMLFLERQLAARGVLDFGKRSFSYERWSVADTAADVPYEFFIGPESVNVGLDPWLNSTRTSSSCPRMAARCSG